MGNPIVDKAEISDGYSNPVYAHDAPDITAIIGSDGLYHGFTTQSLYGGASLVNMPHLVSRDLVDWRFIGDAMPTLPKWVGGSIWAPHVDFGGDGYVIYYSALRRDLDEHAVGVQTGPTLQGGFTDRGAPLVERAQAEDASFAAIDPFSMTTPDGRRLLYWGSGHAPIRVQELARNGMSLVRSSSEVLRPFADVHGYGKLVEAATVEHRVQDGHYYMWVSGDNTHEPHYAVSEFRSPFPDGDFEREPNPLNPILRDNADFIAPGHHCQVIDDAGQLWVLYHANLRSDFSTYRKSRPPQMTTAGLPGVPWRLCLDRVEVLNDGWSRVNGGSGPSSISRSRPVIGPSLSRATATKGDTST